MITKNEIKLIGSLHQKKGRNQHQLFIAEGQKLIAELLDAEYELYQVFETESLFEKVSDANKKNISIEDLKKISCLSTPNNCLAVFKIANAKLEQEGGLKVVLDDIRDPGNLGTIIRLCDWFGVTDLICSVETVDVYNPKVVQATMGSLARVNVIYADLENYLHSKTIPIYGTFMDGKTVYQEDLAQEAFLILGNEANGISKNIEKLVTNKISIPRFGSSQKTESLNVATAAGIFLSEFRR